MLDRIAQGEKLVSERTYLEKRDTYAVSFYWQDAKYSAEYDVVVMRLLGRQAIRPTQVAGGMVVFELSEQYRSAMSG